MGKKPHFTGNTNIGEDCQYREPEGWRDPPEYTAENVARKAIAACREAIDWIEGVRGDMTEVLNKLRSVVKENPEAIDTAISKAASNDERHKKMFGYGLKRAKGGD